MQLAALLADLNSLNLCSHTDALNLVNAHQTVENDRAQQQLTHRSASISGLEETDPDLRRAGDLLALHYEVKVKRVESGPDVMLLLARRQVDAVVRALRASDSGF